MIEFLAYQVYSTSKNYFSTLCKFFHVLNVILLYFFAIIIDEGNLEMTPPPKSLTFSDLGLNVELPSVLSKSQKERKTDYLEKKKAKKVREKEALEVVAASREIILKRKREIMSENLKLTADKEQRKKLIRIEHNKSRIEREQKEKEVKEAAIVSQNKVITKMKSEWNEAERKEKVVLALLNEELDQFASNQPLSVNITANRTEKIAQQRRDLPVLREEQPIMEAINACDRSCVLIAGETGSGKTTQIPQFLWESGYGHPEGSVFGREGRILVTEPRRVAAVSMARRVAEELNVRFGGEVCYHVRYDNNLSDNCQVKFATEGVILKEIQSDFLLKQYSVIIIDEAHERSISCDILVGFLSRMVPLRNDLYKEELRKVGGNISLAKIKPLKLVIMSATLQISDFQDNRKLFPVVPRLIQVEARRYPVSNHFSRKTELKDYLEDAFKTVRQIHKKLPPGGILVFLPTQQEIESLCDRLRKHYQVNKIEYSSKSYNKHSFLVRCMNGEASSDEDGEKNEKKLKTISKDMADEEVHEKDEFGLEPSDYSLEDERAEHGRTDDHFRNFVTKDQNKTKTLASGEKDKHSSHLTEPNDLQHKVDDDVNLVDSEVNGEFNTLHVLPLYALLDFQRQQEVFKPPPNGKRLCVVATNVAETSLTIPDIKYVVDTGRAKMKAMEEATKASCYRIQWISQASAEQRSGRAGRMGPGHCYRLFSTAVYANLMPKHTTPEILRTPLDTVVLLMKQVGIQDVSSFPFPSSPSRKELEDALTHLHIIGALGEPSQRFQISSLGRCLVNYPVAPRFARALLEVTSNKYSKRMIEIVCAVVGTISTVKTILTREGNELKNMRTKGTNPDPRIMAVKALLNPGSDLVTYLIAFATFYAHPHLCDYFCMVKKSMREALLLYHQIRSIVANEARHSHCYIDRKDSRKACEHRSELELEDTMDTSDEGSSAPQNTEDSCFDSNCSPFSLLGDEELLLRRLFIPGFLDQVARRATVHECRTLRVPYIDRSTGKAPYILMRTKTVAYVHPTSSVAKTVPPAEFLTFSYLEKVLRSDNHDEKTMMLGCTIVLKEWLQEYGFSEGEE